MNTLAHGDTLTPKERVRRTFAHETPDRVPIGYDSNPGIDRRLKAYFGLAADDSEGLRQALGVDFRGLWAPYTGKRLHGEIPGRNVEPQFGYRMRWVEHGNGGGYWDFCDFPLRDADEQAVADWPMPNPDDYDYEQLKVQCQQHNGYALFIGNAGLGCVINTAGFFRGMEQVFVDLVTDDPAGLLLIDRFLDIQFEQTRRSLELVGRDVDFVWMGEDLGTQIAPLISRPLFLRHILPRHQRFVDLAKEYGLPVMLHTCGSSSWAYEDYISIGVKAVDTLQPEARDMSPEHLKKTFGGRLVFHGCVSTAGVVATGTVEDTVRDVRRTLGIMMPGSGYCLAPTHQLQDNTPTENAVAMYEAAHRYGRY